MLSLDSIEEKLNKARTPQEIFGEDIELGLKNLQVLCHPERYVGDPDKQQRAEAIFKRLGALADQAKTPVTKIKSPKREYELISQLAVGDVSDVHLCKSTKNDMLYIMKVSRVPGGEKMLEREYEILQDLHTVAKDATYRKYYPIPVESFPIRHKIQRRINMFPDPGKQPTLLQLHERLPELDGRHIVWIFKRILVALGFAHKQNHLHGAILPEHVMIKPDDHGLQLIGWGQSVEVGQPIKVISNKYKDWYPTEVLRKAPAGPGTDIYMAARCMLELAGGERTHTAKVPDSLVRFLQGCLLPGIKMRPNRAWDLHEEFDDFVKKVYGPPKFVPLTV